MKGQEVEQDTHFKYRGTIIANKLTFQTNADYIEKNARQQLYLLRKVRASKHTLTMVYRSLTESILTLTLCPGMGSLSYTDELADPGG